MAEQPTDEALMKGIVQRDSESFRKLVDRHGAYLFGVARAVTRNVYEAEDAVQETLLAILKARYQGGASVRTFLVSILVRQAALIRRKKRSWLRFVPELVEQPSRTDEVDPVDAKLDLPVLLEQLSDEHREVIVMRELEGMSYDEIAKTLGVPRGTVESRLHRARELLKEIWLKK